MEARYTVAFIVIAYAISTVVGCSNPEEARRALVSSGYTEIKTTGYEWVGCEAGEVYKTGFVAINPIGNKAKGTVCGGLIFKGSTIRF